MWVIDLFDAMPWRAISSPLCREQNNVTVFANGISWRKITITSLHSQKSPRWAQQMYVTKEKDRNSECCKKVLYAGPKSARNILTNLSPNPARPEKPGPTCKSGLTILLIFCCTNHEFVHSISVTENTSIELAALWTLQPFSQYKCNN